MTQPTRDASQLMTEYLATADDECPSCGYALRGLLGDRCPECNQLLRLRVALVESRLAAFLATTIALSSGFGFSALLVLYLIVTLIVRSKGSPPGAFVVIVGTGVVVNGSLIVLLMKTRGAFCRAGAAQRWGSFICAVLLNLALLACFILYVR